MKRLNEKIMIGLLAASLIGFLIAPCCWHKASKTSPESIVECSSNAIVFHDVLQQKNMEKHTTAKTKSIKKTH